MTRKTLLGTLASAPGNDDRIESRTSERTSRRVGVVQGIRLALAQETCFRWNTSDVFPQYLIAQLNRNCRTTIQAHQRINTVPSNARDHDVNRSDNPQGNELLQ